MIGKGKIFKFSMVGLFKLLFSITLAVQLFVILYNHFNGLFKIDSFSSFLLILSLRLVIGLIASYIVAIPIILFISFLNKILPWNSNLLERILYELLFVFFISAFINILVTVVIRDNFSFARGDYGSFVINSIIYTAVNLLLISLLEGWMFFEESKMLKRESEKLKEDIKSLHYEILKSQINPHFLFNSLNVLSGLVRTDKNMSIMFIDEFATIYRYILDYLEEPLVSLKNEIDFSKSYIELQKIRFGDSLSYRVEICEEYYLMELPTLSLQLVLENIFNHNVINEKNPLEIFIYIKNNSVYVENVLQPKQSRSYSTGIGQKNLFKRYSLYTKKQPVFSILNDKYLSILPLINNKNESINS